MAVISKTLVPSNQAPQPLGPYSQGVIATPGRVLSLAGQLGVDASGSIIDKTDSAAQTRQSLGNIGHVPAGASGNFDNAVEFITFVLGRESIPAYLQSRSVVYREIYPNGYFPANTLLSRIRPGNRIFFSRIPTSCSPSLALLKRQQFQK